MMVVDRIKLKDFRCFEECQVDFAPGFNVLIGKNGAGKTALINALVKALSFMFSNNRTLGPDFISAGLSTLNVRTFDHDDFRRIDKFREVAPCVRLDAEAHLNQSDSEPMTSLNWTLLRNSTSGAALQPTLYKDAYIKMTEIFKRGGEMPVVTYYSDSFPHHNVRTTRQLSEAAAAPEMQRNFAYYQWDAEDACMSLWESRFCNVLNRNVQASKLMDDNPEDEEKIRNTFASAFDEENAISDVMREFSRRLPGDWIIQTFLPIGENGDWSLGMTFPDGQTRRLGELPAGYRRLFSMALDLAYRSWTLNKTVSPSGVAVIDEMDLHLHPELEQSVADALMQTFPNIQFIASSHSPLVISNLAVSDGRNRVISFDSGTINPVTVPDLYGMDVETSLSDVMGVSLRSSEIRSLAESYRILADNGFKEDADKILTLIENRNVDKDEFIRIANVTFVSESI